MKSHFATTRPFAVAVAGLGPRGWHHLERLSLRDDVRIAAAWDPSLDLCTRARQQGWSTPASLESLVHDDAIDGVIVAAALAERADVVAHCLSAGKHVLVEPPVARSASDAARLYDLAAAHSVCLSAASPRRWEDDLRAARLAVRSGRLGALRTLRLTSATWSPGMAVATSDSFQESRSTLELLAPHVLDQLAELTSSELVRVWTQPFPNEDGFLAVLALADGAVVPIDLRRRSFTGRQTGWQLEGEAGGYRGGRIYTPTADGELVDEAIRLEPAPPDPLFDDWLARCATGAGANERSRGEQLAAMYERLAAALASE